jgi:hypothetical protein
VHSLETHAHACTGNYREPWPVCSVRTPHPHIDTPCTLPYDAAAAALLPSMITAAALAVSATSGTVTLSDYNGAPVSAMSWTNATEGTEVGCSTYNGYKLHALMLCGVRLLRQSHAYAHVLVTVLHGNSCKHATWHKPTCCTFTNCDPPVSVLNSAAALLLSAALCR